jgi:predicted transcriptional regulator
MAKYRDRVRIIADILKVAREGAKKTKIMYIANLSYSLLEKYLRETTAMGFLSHDDSAYQVTEKGLVFLEKYDDFSSKYSRVENEVQKMLFEKEALERLCEPVKNSHQKNSQKLRRKT